MEDTQEYVAEYQALLRQAGLAPSSGLMPGDAEAGEGGGEAIFVGEPIPASDETVALMNTVPRQQRSSQASLAGATMADSVEDGGNPEDEISVVEALGARETPSEPPSEQYFSMPAAPSVVDLDIDSLAYDLENHNRGVKKAIMSRFMAVKKKLLQHEQEVLDSERRQWAAKLAAKQDELEHARDALHKANGEVKTTRVYLDRAVSTLSRRAALQRAYQVAHVVLRKWQEAAAFQKRSRHNVHRAVRHYDRNFLMRSYFRSWRSWTFTTQKMSMEEVIAMQVDDATAKAEGVAQRKVDAMAAEVARMRERLATEMEHRAGLEEKMKQAFMRGVCALNIEAMTMMKGGYLPPDIAQGIAEGLAAGAAGGGGGAGENSSLAANLQGGGGATAAPAPRASAAVPAPAPRGPGGAPASRDLGLALAEASSSAPAPVPMMSGALSPHSVAPLRVAPSEGVTIVHGPAPLMFHHPSGRSVDGAPLAQGGAGKGRTVTAMRPGSGRSSNTPRKGKQQVKDRWF